MALSNIANHGGTRPLVKRGENLNSPRKQNLELAYDPENVKPLVVWLSPDDMINVVIRPKPRKAQPDPLLYHSELPRMKRSLTDIKVTADNKAVYDKAINALRVFEQTEKLKKALDSYRALLIRS